MGYNIVSDSPLSTPSRTNIEGWIDNYKQQFVEHSHDQSMLSLVTPDDSLIVVGPPRLSGNASDFYIVGFINSLQYTESAQVQPMKAIGSRRHVFSRTNQPVQGSIGRMMVLGSNLYRALYAVTELSDKIKDNNSRFATGGSGADSSWYVNLEEDLFRIPFGLGIIYNSPASLASGDKHSAGAEFIEACTIINRSASHQAQQAMVMEQVTFMADRVVPWDAYAGPDFDVGSAANNVGDMMS